MHCPQRNIYLSYNFSKREGWHNFSLLGDFIIREIKCKSSWSPFPLFKSELPPAVRRSRAVSRDHQVGLRWVSRVGTCAVSHLSSHLRIHRRRLHWRALVHISGRQGPICGLGSLLPVQPPLPRRSQYKEVWHQEENVRCLPPPKLWPNIWSWSGPLHIRQLQQGWWFPLPFWEDKW